MTAHHIIFRYDDAREKEMWVSDVLTACMVMLNMSLSIDALPIDIPSQSPTTELARPITTELSNKDV